MTAIVPVNSLMVMLGCNTFTHTDYETRASDSNEWNYNQLMEKVPLKHLTVSWGKNSSLIPKECPAVKLVVDLLRVKTTEL